MSKPLTRRDRQMRPIPAEPSMDVPVRQFEKAATRARIQEILERETGSKFVSLLGMMTDPARVRWSFAAMMKAADVSLHELMAMYNDSCRMDAMMAMASELPAVAADIAEDAKSTSAECPMCTGKGVVGETDDERECIPCGGTGSVRQAGNKHARDLMFQSAGIISNGKMSVAAGTQIQLGADMDAGIESLLRVTTGIVMKVGS